jgi:acetyltransferase-like isoleucine patch superfamily enzyme
MKYLSATALSSLTTAVRGRRIRQPQSESDWRLEETVVHRRASLGSGAIIMCGVDIGEGAMVGAGALVTHDVPPHSLVAGVPARLRPLATLGIGNGAVEPQNPAKPV